MKHLFILSLVLFSLGAKATDHVIGSGSGTVSQTSMSGLTSGDRLLITPGTYSGADFENLTNITIINNNGLVTFTGGWTFLNNKNVTVSGTGSATITYGFVATGLTGDLVNMGSGNYYGIRFYNWEFFNCAGAIWDYADNGATFSPNDTTTFKLFKCSLANIRTHNCNLITQGYFGTTKPLIDVIDSVSFFNIIIDSTSSTSGQMFALGSAFLCDLHDFNIYGKLTDSVGGDVGVIIINGNAKIHNIYRYKGRGYIARIWNVGLIKDGQGGKSNKPSSFYNNIDLAHTDYGTLDTRNDNTYYDTTNSIAQSDSVYNNTSGNLYSISYTCPLMIIGSQYNGAQTYFYNNVQFNATTYLGPNEIPIMIDNSGGTWNTSDSAGNRIYSAANALNAFSDTAAHCYPINGRELTTAYSSVVMANPDIWGNTGNRIGAAAYPGALATPPALTAAGGATVGGTFTVTYPSSSAWASALTSITVNGVTISPTAYTVTSTGTTFNPANSSLLQSAPASLAIVFIATGYSNDAVTQSIGVGNPYKLSISTQPTAPLTNPANFNVQPIIKIQDLYSNFISTATNSVTATIGSGSSWSLSGTTTVTASGGIATFTTLGASNTLTVNNSVTIIFTSSGLISATSNSIILAPLNPPGCSCVAMDRGGRINYLVR